jgi:O-antigen/teichoic acid export membrane protein
MSKTNFGGKSPVTGWSIFSRLTQSTFFRQSGWMLFATTLSGVFFYATHIPASRLMDPNEYGVFNTLLQVLNQMAIPSVGLLTIFVQQAAMSETEEHRRELAGAVRSVLKATVFFWLLTAAVVFLSQKKLLADYKIKNPVALWATVVLGLVSLWTPVMSGILQGRQDFLWLGLMPIVSASTRFALITGIVMLVAGQAAGAVIGVLLSMTAAMAIGIWKTWPLWRGKAAKFYWTPWLKKVLPLTLGLGANTFMFTVDMLAVQRFLEDSGIYGAAGMIGRALVFMVAPLTTVMFPKIVRAAAKSERTDVMAQALGATALMAGAAALFCTFFPDLPIRIVQGEKYLAAAPLVRWFAWCVLPLMVSTVLVNNLMARERYAVVPWLVAVAALYAFALWQPVFHSSHTRVIQTLGGFAVIYLAVCVFFTWRRKPAASVPDSPLPPAV